MVFHQGLTGKVVKALLTYRYKLSLYFNGDNLETDEEKAIRKRGNNLSVTSLRKQLRKKNAVDDEYKLFYFFLFFK